MSTTNMIKVFNPDTKETIEYTMQGMIQHGFKSFGLHAWCDAWVDSYNQYTLDINRCTYQPERDLLLDNRHKFFVYCDTAAKETN